MKKFNLDRYITELFVGKTILDCEFVSKLDDGSIDVAYYKSIGIDVPKFNEIITQAAAVSDGDGDIVISVFFEDGTSMRIESNENVTFG